MIYLYVKTHNLTGLRYLGKTKSSDPYSYRGSGKVWTRHIKKHGYDVTTEIIFQSTNPIEIRQQGLYYSRLWNVVNSKEWANLKEESGDGGWDQKLTSASIQNLYGVDNPSHIPEVRQKLSLITVGLKNKDLRNFANEAFRLKYGADHPMQVLKIREKANSNRIATFQTRYGVTNPLQIPDIKERQKQALSKIGHQQGSKNSQYGTMWITNGLENKKIKRVDNIPEGWYKGRVNQFSPT